MGLHPAETTTFRLIYLAEILERYVDHRNVTVTNKSRPPHDQKG